MRLWGTGETSWKSGRRIEAAEGPPLPEARGGSQPRGATSMSHPVPPGPDLPQLHSFPSVVMRRLWAAQDPETTVRTRTPVRQPYLWGPHKF